MTTIDRRPDPRFSTPETLASLRKANLGVDWHLPGKRRRFATTTKATSDLIAALGEEGYTFEQALDAVFYDLDAAVILEHFCTEGYGGEMIAKHVA